MVKVVSTAGIPQQYRSRDLYSFITRERSSGDERRIREEYLAKRRADYRRLQDRMNKKYLEK